MTGTLFKWAGVQQNAAVKPSSQTGWRAAWRTRWQARWQTWTAVLSATGLVALSAHIAVPLGVTPVPITMQTFAVLLIGLLFSPRAAFCSLALYLAEGAIGLPVFTPYGPAGIAHLLGPTGGYLLAYPFAAALASFFYRYARRGFFAAMMGAFAGGILILIVGAFWLEVLTHAQFPIVAAESIAPFLVGDALKVMTAAACASVFDKFRRSSGNSPGGLPGT